jgi:hypothetical protein
VTFILDASITLAWCFEDQTTRLTGAALERFREDWAVAAEL